jgi:homoaconitase/3-isopropylmalate dehydratase large subunit
MGTLVEEIFSQKAGRKVEAGEIVLLDVDTIMSHDNTTPLAIQAFREIGKPIMDKSKIVIHFDHAFPAPSVLAAENQKMITARWVPFRRVSALQILVWPGSPANPGSASRRPF